tara:strand:- start:1793 stop:2758 length:966 start_codon:yes stop_codon:yes gene_type:complete
MNKKQIFIWCCDLSKSTGEGVMANKFINDLKSFNQNLKININQPSKRNNIIIERFLYPLLGIIYLWKVFFVKKNKTICYVNYLPLWNFLLFFTLPPNTLLGPVTGGSFYNKKSLINYILRKYILNLFNQISILIINFRYKKLLFSTDLLKKKINNDEHYFNYVLKDLKIKKNSIKKKYDLIFYLNKHKNKNINLQIQLANKLSSNFRIITVGEKIKNPEIINFGYITRKNLLKILKKTKFAFLSPENLYSLFAIDSISSNTNIFFNKVKNYKSYNLKGIYYIDYNNFNNMLAKIEKRLIRKFVFTIKHRSIKKKFSNYFKI